MADAKISDLTAYSTYHTDDLMVVVDTHDTTMAASGTDKKYALGTFITDALPIIAINKGGTGQTTASTGFNALSPMTTVGDIIYGGTSGTGTRLAGPTTATKQFLTSTGTGSAAQSPAWNALAAADLPTTGLTINQHSSLVTTDSDGSTITFDLSVSDWHQVTLGGNRTLAVSNSTLWQPFTIVLIQASSGGPYSPTWFSGITWLTSTFAAPSMPTTASAVIVCTFKRFGTNQYYGFFCGASAS